MRNFFYGCLAILAIIFVLSLTGHLRVDFGDSDHGHVPEEQGADASEETADGTQFADAGGASEKRHQATQLSIKEALGAWNRAIDETLPPKGATGWRKLEAKPTGEEGCTAGETQVNPKTGRLQGCM